MYSKTEERNKDTVLNYIRSKNRLNWFQLYLDGMLPVVPHPTQPFIENGLHMGLAIKAPNGQTSRGHYMG